MASINSLLSTTSTPAYYAARSVKKNGQDPMAKVADMLGLSRDDLKTKLSSGKSLDDVAIEQGVTHQGLISAIKQGLPSDATSATQSADQVAEKIASAVGVSPAPSPPPAPPSGDVPGGPKGENSGLQDTAKLSGLSRLLSMDPSAVAGSATSASSLVSLVQSQGVDLTRLKSVLNSGDLLDVSA
jgi:uncharacterized protein YidB (DUF937 family)